MRHIAIILFLILTLISCKNQNTSESKAEEGIDKTVYEMWDNFTESNPGFKDNEMPESWYFHNNEKDANRLAKLIVNGKKKEKQRR